MAEENDFFVVALGTSSGGLSILKDILAQLPEQNNAAFIIIQHLHPGMRSILHELLAPFTKMPVYRATEGQLVKTGCIYVLPENKVMTIKDKRLRLAARDIQVINTAINIFFESMGPELKDRAIGIILSGGGRDGTEGTASIHQHGGLVMVQKPSTAEFKGMPESSESHGYSNFTMPIKGLIETLAELIRPRLS